MNKTDKSKDKTNKTAKAGESIKAKLAWLPKYTFELTFIIPWKKVKKNYQATLEKVAKETTIKGFRKGKAPLKMVEQNVNQPALYEEVLKQLLPEYFAKAVKEHNLKPIISPKVELIKSGKEQDWVFKATSCELPQTKVEGFEKIVKEAIAKTKIWTPDKGTPDKKEDEKKTQNQKLSLIFKALLEKIEVDLPDLLTEEEVSRKLSVLLNQINRLGLTLDQYLASIQKTVSQLRKEYKKQTEDTLKIEFILQAIAQKRKIAVADEEIEKLINSAPDEKTKQLLQTPAQKSYLRTSLIKQKVVDFLLTL